MTNANIKYFHLHLSRAIKRVGHKLRKQTTTICIGLLLSIQKFGLTCGWNSYRTQYLQCLQTAGHPSTPPPPQEKKKFAVQTSLPKVKEFLPWGLTLFSGGYFRGTCLACLQRDNFCNGN